MARLDTIAEPQEVYPTILVLDFGSQHTHLIIRRLRELNVYSELLPCTTRLAELRFKPAGLILSGGPYSVYDDGAPHFDPAYLHLGTPILGIGYGLSELAYRLDRTNVVAGVPGEYALAEVTAQITNARFDPLFHCIEGPMKAWMSHGDRLAKLPEGFHAIATTENSRPAAIAHDTHPIYGVQFHPEVPHTPKGAQLLRNFVVSICGVNASRVPDTFVEQETGRKRKTAKPSNRGPGTVGSGMDAKVAARLSHRFAAVLADFGYLRHEEREQVERDTAQEHLRINLRSVDASNEFYPGLRIGLELEEGQKFVGGILVGAV